MNKERHERQDPLDWGQVGQSQDRQAAEQATASILAHPQAHVKPQAIPTSVGGVHHWLVCDSLASFRHELEKAGIVKPGDPQVWEAQFRAWQLMLTETSYVSPSVFSEVLEEADAHE